VDTEVDVTLLVPSDRGDIWAGLSDLGAGFGDDAGTVALLDPDSGGLGPRLAVANVPYRLVSRGEVLWLVRNDDAVVRVDLGQARPGPDAAGITLAGPTTAIDGVETPVDWNPVDIAVAGDFAWAVDGTSSILYRLDPASGEVVGQTALDVDLDSSPGRRVLSVTPAGLWVHSRGRLLRVDPGSGRVTGHVALSGVTDTFVDDDSVWGVSRSDPEDVLERWDLQEVLEQA
jgi:hypothetical protein